VRARSYALIAAGLAIAPSLAAAQEAEEDPEAPTVTVGGYLQPQFRARQNSDADGDTNGFRMRRARVTFEAERAVESVDVGVEAEVELTPETTMMDATAWISGGGLPLDTDWSFTVGQFKAPFSRQTLLSDSKIQFVEKAQINSLAPDRQIGAQLGLEVKMVELKLGLFNGEGRNQVQNIDEQYMFVGRIEVTPFGRGAAFAEGGFEDHLRLGANGYQNTFGPEDTLGFGGDVSIAWHGASLAGEYVEVRHEFSDSQPDYTAKGWAGQAGYLLPLGGFLEEKIELAARVEEIDRNDAVPVDAPGDPNQSQRLFTGGATFYQARHGLKLSANYTHVVEIEQEDRAGNDIRHDNDIVLLQVTYRME
jgi:phosphate-selective porin